MGSNGIELALEALDLRAGYLVDAAASRFSQVCFCGAAVATVGVVAHRSLRYMYGNTWWQVASSLNGFNLEFLTSDLLDDLSNIIPWSGVVGKHGGG